MSNYKYHYVISKENSPQRFKEACAIIEAKLPGVQKKEFAVDVDGSTIQVYEVNGEEIVLIDDYDIGVVFADSNIEIASLFEEQAA